MRLPEIDAVAARVHAAWVEEKLKAGIKTRPSALTGQEQMVPFVDLHETDKDSNRLQVRTIYRAIEELSK